MTNYYQHHSLLTSEEKMKTNVNHSNQTVKDLKEKIVTVEKNQKHKSNLFKFKITLLLLLSHTFVFLLTFSFFPETMPLEEKKQSDFPPTSSRNDEVQLSVPLILFSNFQKTEKAKWVDIYSPEGTLYLKKISLLYRETKDEEENSYLEQNKSLTLKHYEVIVKKADAPLILRIINKNFHALPSGINLNKPQKKPTPPKTVFKRKTDPFQKPWSHL